MVYERFIEHHMKMIRLDGVEVWHFGGKDVFVGSQLEVAAKSQIGL